MLQHREMDEQLMDRRKNGGYFSPVMAAHVPVAVNRKLSDFK